MVSASDIKFYKSNNAGLGGAIDLDARVISGDPNNLFPLLTEAERVAGGTRYRLLYIKNEHDADTVKDFILWEYQGTPDNSTTMDFAKGSSGKNGTEPTIPDQYTEPTGLSWTTDNTKKEFPDLKPGDYYPVWFRNEWGSDANIQKSDTAIYKFKMTSPTPVNPPTGGGTGTTATRLVHYCVTRTQTGNYDRTTTMGEEIVESLTDPDPLHKYGTKSWYNPEGAGHPEIGDLCDSYPDQTYASGLKVHQYWSNNDNNCVAPHIEETDLGGSTVVENPDSGPVLKDAVIYMLFWGSDWNSRGATPTKAGYIDKIQNDMLDTDVEFFSKLSQYGGVNPPTWGGAVTNTNFPIPSGHIEKYVDIEPFITDCFNRGLLDIPADDNENIYYVMLPVDKLITDASGGLGINGYHGVYKPTITTTPDPDPNVDPPDPVTTNWKICVVGDIDSTSAAQKVAGLMDDYDRIIGVGDYSYGDISGFRDLMDDHNLKSKFIGIPPGNHEEDDGYNEYKGYFGIGNTVFMKKFENMAVITCDSNVDMGGSQKDTIEGFLDSAEADPNIDWIVLTMHHPWFGSGSDHDMNEQGQVQDLMPTCLSHKVAFIFTGHNHYWQRSHKVSYNSGDPESPNIVDSDNTFQNTTSGLVHVTSGTGGHDGEGNLYPLKDSLGGDNPNAYQNNSHNGVYEILASNEGRTLKCRFKDVDGDLHDTITYTAT